MAGILSLQAGEEITPAQLLGEDGAEATQEELAAKERELEQKLAARAARRLN